MSYDPDEMLAEHQQIWQSFMKLVTYTSVSIIILLALMAIFLV